MVQLKDSVAIVTGAGQGIGRAIDQFGHIEILVNNAGLTFMSGIGSARFDTMDVEEWDRVLRTNLTSVFLVSRAVAHLTRNMAVALAPDGVLVTAIAPGPILTEAARETLAPDRLPALGVSIPLARPGRPEEIAAVAVFLASDEASFITSVTIPVDGGFLANHRGMQ